MNPTSAEVDLVQEFMRLQHIAPAGREQAIVELMGGVEEAPPFREIAVREIAPDDIPERLSLGKGFSLKLAVSAEDRLKCWRLVYEEYLAHGYTQPQELEYRYSIQDALPDTATFLIEDQGHPAGTVTVFPDSPLGLPADEIFRRELDGQRADRRRPVEIGRLTIGKAYMNNRLLLTSLFDILSIHARRVRHATDLVITVNPTHVKFYEKMLLFERIGTQKDLGSVCGAPAVLLRLDLEKQRQVIRWVHGEGPTPGGDLPGRTYYGYFSSRGEEHRRVAWLQRHLRPLSHAFVREYFVERRPLIPSLSSSLRYFIEQFHPDMSPSESLPGL